MRYPRGFSPCLLFLSTLAIFCILVQCGKVDKKRSIALPVKAVKKEKEGPSYLTKLRVVNALEYTLACTLCVDYTNLVKNTLSKSKENYKTTVGADFARAIVQWDETTTIR